MSFNSMMERSDEKMDGKICIRAREIYNKKIKEMDLDEETALKGIPEIPYTKTDEGRKAWRDAYWEARKELYPPYKEGDSVDTVFILIIACICVFLFFMSPEWLQLIIAGIIALVMLIAWLGSKLQ